MNFCLTAASDSSTVSATGTEGQPVLPLPVTSGTFPPCQKGYRQIARKLFEVRSRYSLRESANRGLSFLARRRRWKKSCSECPLLNRQPQSAPWMGFRSKREQVACSFSLRLDYVILKSKTNSRKRTAGKEAGVGGDLWRQRKAK